MRTRSLHRLETAIYAIRMNPVVRRASLEELGGVSEYIWSSRWMSLTVKILKRDFSHALPIPVEYRRNALRMVFRYWLCEIRWSNRKGLLQVSCLRFNPPLLPMHKS